MSVAARSLQSELPMTSNAPFFALLIVPALLTSGCAVHQVANGTVSYTSTPPVADHSGALPLSSLVCVDDSHRVAEHTAGVRLGSCQLAGFDHPHRGRGATSGGETELHAVGGACELPTSTGPLPLRVSSATLQYEGQGVDITVGGTTNDGRYVTYRFTGMLGANAPSGDCDSLLSAASTP